MTPSQRASRKGGTQVGAGMRSERIPARLRDKTRVDRRHLPRVAPSIRRLQSVLAASLLVLAFAPANALAESGSPEAQPTSTHALHSATRVHDSVVPSSGDVRVVLALGSGYDNPHGSELVRALQRRLAQAGNAPGPIDGRFGPLTEQAVRRFQAGHGMAVDGVAGPVTSAALSSPTPVLYPGGGIEEPAGSSLVRALQRRLARAGDRPGRIDGRYGPLTEQAVKRFQADHHLRVDGIAGRQTLSELGWQEKSHPVQRRPLASRPNAGSHRRPRVPGTPSVRRAHRAGWQVGWFALLLVVALVMLLTAARYMRHGRGHRLGGRSPSHPKESQTLEATADRTPEAEKAHTLDPRGALDPKPVSGLAVAAQESRIRATHRSNHAEDEGDAAFNLGVLLEKRNDPAGAEAAYRRAEELGHAAGACNLGTLLEKKADLAGAEAAYRRAESLGNSDGAFNLGVLLEERSDHVGAMAALRRADLLGHAPGASNLGVMLERRGDLPGAEAAYRRAAERGDANGAFNLGALLEERNDLGAAEAAYRRAEQSGNSDVAEMARDALLELRSMSTTAKGGSDNDE